MPGCVRRHSARVRDSQQFNEHARQLDNVIFRSPRSRVPVARANSETKPAIKVGGFIEIAYSVNDVIEPAGHTCSCAVIIREDG